MKVLFKLLLTKDSGKELMDIADSLNNEDVIEVKGKVVKRSSVNPDMKTGEVEVDATEIDILNKSKVPPFEIKDDINAAEQTRLKYRYLDLRRPTLQKGNYASFKDFKKQLTNILMNMVLLILKLQF